MRFALMTEPQQGLSYVEILALARAAESAGLEAFFRSDHYGSFVGPPDGPTTDAWSTLAGLARDTTTIRIGSLVSPVTFRVPGSFAKVVATVDEMSGGRVEVGMGAGWNEEEHLELGIPFPPLGDRYDRLEESLAIARRHHLYVPVRLTLLSKTIIMHEGLARHLDPEFNLAEHLAPYARELAVKAYLPQRWAKRIVPALLDLSELMVTLPRRIDRLLGQVEQGNVSLNMRVQETEHVLDTLNRMINRLILAIIAAGFIIGIALLLQVYHAAELHWLIGWLLGVGFAGVMGLAMWLIFSILRRGHH